jgi:peptidoglycan/LPS O-acetylase OafA/YrhL
MVPGHIYIAAVFALLLIGLSYFPVGALVNRLTRHIGLVSFSCYIFHFAVLDVLRQWFGTELVSKAWHNAGAAGSWIPKAVLPLTGLYPMFQYGILFISALFVTVLVSTLSYHVIERPGIWLGRRLIRELGW